MATPDLAKRFGTAVRAERERQGVSQERLSDLADLDRTYVSGLERGLRNPTLGSMEKLAHALNVKVSKLVADAERRKS